MIKVEPAFLQFSDEEGHVAVAQITGVRTIINSAGVPQPCYEVNQAGFVTRYVPLEQGGAVLCVREAERAMQELRARPGAEPGAVKARLEAMIAAERRGLSG
jgi:hypothetical protein